MLGRLIVEPGSAAASSSPPRRLAGRVWIVRRAYLDDRTRREPTGVDTD